MQGNHEIEENSKTLRPVHYLDRSSIESMRRCDRKYYFGALFPTIALDGLPNAARGLSSTSIPFPLITGAAVHRGVEEILRATLTHSPEKILAITQDPWAAIAFLCSEVFPTIEVEFITLLSEQSPTGYVANCFFPAFRAYHSSNERSSADNPVLPSYTALLAHFNAQMRAGVEIPSSVPEAIEQLYLAKALVANYFLCPEGIPALLTTYEILAVEPEIQFSLDEAICKASSFGFHQTTIAHPSYPNLNEDFARSYQFNSRPDAILRDRLTKLVYPYSLKTCVAYDSRLAEVGRIDLQGLTECIATTLYMKLDTPSKFVPMTYLVKGKKRRDDSGTQDNSGNSVSTQAYQWALTFDDLKPEVDLTNSISSALINPYLNMADTFPSADSITPKYRMQQADGKIRQVSKFHESVNIWEHAVNYPNMPFGELLDELIADSDNMQATLQTANFQLAQYIVWLNATHPIIASSYVVTPECYERNLQDIGRELATMAVDVDIAIRKSDMLDRFILNSKVDLTEPTTANSIADLILSAYTPTRTQCIYPSKCSFYRLCHSEGGLAKLVANASSPQVVFYNPRKLNHPETREASVG